MEYLHSMIRVGDLPAALDFFCSKLGFIEVKRVENEKGRFTLIYLAAPGDLARAKEFNAPVVEFTYNWDETEYSRGRNFGHLAYRVENIYDLCADLMKKGVIINRPPRDGHMAFIKSPDGISIEFLQKGKALEIKEPWKSMENIGEW
ncbi:MAG: VOC family protein [Bdellovibrionota bacterium]